MSEDFKPQGIEQVKFESIEVLPVEETLQEELLQEEPVTVEAPIKKSIKVEKKLVKAAKVIQHRPSTVHLLLEDGSKTVVKKSQYDRVTRVVTL